MKRFFAILTLVLAPTIVFAAPWDDFAGFKSAHLALQKGLRDSRKLDIAQERGAEHAYLYGNCRELALDIKRLRAQVDHQSPIGRTLWDLLQQVNGLQEEIIRVRAASPSLRPASPLERAAGLPEVVPTF